jgi:hypothetical protein
MKNPGHFAIDLNNDLIGELKIAQLNVAIAA